MISLWNLAYPAPGEVQFDLTGGDALAGVSGPWVRSALRALDVEAEPRAWALTAFRSDYYTDYGSSAEWRDRWPRVWTVRAEVDFLAPPPPTPVLHTRRTLDAPGLEHHLDAEPRADDEVLDALLIAAVRASVDGIDEHRARVAELLARVAGPAGQWKVAAHAFRGESHEHFERMEAAGPPAGMAEFLASLGTLGAETSARRSERARVALLPLWLIRVERAGTAFPTEVPLLEEVSAALRDAGYLRHRHDAEYESMSRS